MSNIKISDNVMDEIRNLLNQDITEKGKKSYHPKQLFRAGVPTKKALAFNRKLIRENKTTTYLDQTKIYNKQTDRFINKPIDRRSGKVKQSYLKKNVVFNSIVVPRKQTNNFRFTGSTGEKVYSSDLNLNNNDLLRRIIIDNKIKGNYRLIITKNGNTIIDSNYDINQDFWKLKKIDFQVDSDNMVWNFNVKPTDVINFIFTKEKLLPQRYYEQKFLDGIGHCFLTPVIEWATNSLHKTNNKSTKKKYEAILNKINGKKTNGKKTKIGYIELYKHGIPEKKIGEFCEDLQIGVKIEQPFANNTLYEYRSNKKPLKIFNFLNTRYNHVDFNIDKTKFTTFKSYEPTYVTRIELTDLMNTFLQDKTPIVYTKDNYGVNSIKTLTHNYKIKNEYRDAVAEFEKENNMRYFSIDGKRYPNLQAFINRGTNFNGTVDYEETNKWRKLKKDALQTEMVKNNVKHIDMIKAYSQFKKSKFYCGFMGKITDFRKVDNHNENGLYYITDLNMNNCSKNFKKLNTSLNWFLDNNIYTKAELDALKYYKGEFKVKYGAYGVRMDFDFNYEMLNTKELIQFRDNEFKIAYYAKWCGMNCRINEKQKVYMIGDREYFENIKTDADIYYADGEARITWENKTNYNRRHITAQITAYQRLNMLEQLLKMDYNKLIRICVDGIYFYDHSFEINDIFDYKEKMTFGNDPCQSYLSNTINYCDEDIDFNSIAEPREFYRSEIFNSAGGNGKTYYNLIKEKGFINPIYVPHSHKLATAMFNECKKHDINLYTSNHHRILSQPFSITEGEILKGNVYVIDECSMLSEHQKQYIFNNCLGKVIFCGDLKCQLPYVCNEERLNFLEKKYGNEIPQKFLKQMNTDGFDNIDKKLVNVNYRFKDEKQKQIIKYVRDNIDNVINFSSLGYNKCSIEDVKKLYKKQDIILVSRGANANKTTNLNDEWTSIFKNNPKYKVLDNSKDYKNGEIIYEKVKNIKSELRHGYTVHSIQGETFKNNIFIDMRYMNFNNKMVYTAISRANYSSQIYLVNDFN